MFSAVANDSTARSPILTADQKNDLEGYTFPFENIVFEGGGNKGLSATGAIRVSIIYGKWSVKGKVQLIGIWKRTFIWMLVNTPPSFDQGASERLFGRIIFPRLAVQTPSHMYEVPYMTKWAFTNIWLN